MVEFFVQSLQKKSRLPQRFVLGKGKLNNSARNERIPGKILTFKAVKTVDKGRGERIFVFSRIAVIVAFSSLKSVALPPSV
jgi:hypothetical protein